MANCDTVKLCTSYEHGKAVKHPTNQTVKRQEDYKEMCSSKMIYIQEIVFLVDHYQSTQPNRLYSSSRGSLKAKDIFCGGIIFVDHATVEVHHQI
jgi:hypothetical protein